MTSSTTPPKGFAGELLTPDHPDYESARLIFDPQYDRRPALIARCATVEDVALAVRHAREHDLEIAVRAGGHSVPGYSTVDGGIVIDLRALDGVAVDAQARRARVQPGVLAGALLRATWAVGLVPASGSEPLPGFVGLAIHGGRGLLRGLGWASDHIRSARLITADAEVMAVSADERPDLLYGLRGAGSSFGIVTGLEVDLHPLPPMAAVGKLVFGPDAIEGVTCGVLELADGDASDGLGLSLTYFADADDGPFVEVKFVHVDAPDRAERDLAAIRGLGAPVDGEIKHMPYAEFLLASELPPGLTRYRWDQQGSDVGARRLAQALMEQAHRLPRATVPGLPNHYLCVEPFGRGFERVPDLPTPVPRSRGWSVAHVGGWSDAAADVAFAEWGRRSAAALRAEGVGNGTPILNYNSETGPAAVRRAYGDEACARLQELKARFDPDDVFHLNHGVGDSLTTADRSWPRRDRR